MVFYNKLNADSERIIGGYEAFADEFATILSRQLDRLSDGRRGRQGRAAAGGAGGGGGAAARPMSEINVTPFVDVMLVLLIIFMVAAPLLTVGVPVELPRDGGHGAADRAGRAADDHRDGGRAHR